ncbi:hypothetical protein PTTG_08057 [Puccinia triticina 1-1 BBBD Race 1]|uniref:Lactamase_B domain-containing protein n=2 Tax=Puccinia triticina TaxID=208348 RepID=A0A180H582_PUCT1|nr:uncharacterized protein PtA15_9A110 [Puccinia triticina]OAW00161.1 hypothetical protein PTTG_08057 [Puccinia triticina 1-1 BBBD Race 1]WAQ87985.1 hypothetical protein PtA15_9A110 [Puccinia triticina]
MISSFFKCNHSPPIHQLIKPRPRPKRILQRPWTKYNLNPSQISQLQRLGNLPKMEKRVRPTDSNRSINPPNQFEITFLGTSAGKPTIQRNPSSLALRMDGQIWIFDCGEATTHQIMRTNLKPSNVTKIFITHLHGDHVLGLISFLSHIGDRAEADLASKNQHPFSDSSDVVEIFGPSGIREFVRSTLRLTKTHSLLKIKVNELLRHSKDHVFTPSLSNPTGPGRLWHNEVLGEDIWSDQNGLWNDVVEVNHCGVRVSAAPIQHTIECVGYLLTEANRREKFDMVKLEPILERHADEIKGMGFKVLPAILSHLEKTRKPISFSTGVTLHPPSLSIRGRRIMILGDTCDPSAMAALIEHDAEVQSIDLLVHEATGTSVPDAHERKQEERQSEFQVARKMNERGHSTSFMAGQFAHRVRATRLILNHLGGKFPAPQAALCPSKSFPPFASSSTQPEDQNAVKTIHAEMWKKFEEMDHPRRAKLVEELAWLKAVENDALDGWRSAARQHSRNLPQNNKPDIPPNINHERNPGKSADDLLVSVAYDFLQINVPRSDQ